MTVSEKLFICTSPVSFFRHPNEHSSAAVASTSKLWKNGQDLRVLFLNGSPQLHEQVMKVAKQWTEFANLSLTEVENAPAEIRIEFDKKGVSYSFVGTDALSISDQSQSTMKFGWIDEQTSESELRRVVLHEFGHALGLEHEHQSSDSQIEWDCEKVYAYFKNLLLPANGTWKDEKEYRDHVDRNIIQRLPQAKTQNTLFDRESIMLYSFPAYLTKNNVGTQHNHALSTLDKQFISDRYPGLNSIRTWYQEYLGRAPEKNTLEHWRKELNLRGPNYVQNYIKNSEEAKDRENRPIIESCYREYLGRSPESEAVVNHWLGMAREKGIQSVKDQIKDSQEASDFANRPIIDSCYREYLGRSPESEAAVNHWLGVARERGIQIVRDLIQNSEEATQSKNRNQIRSYYRQYLHRDPDEGGMNHWLEIARTKGLSIVEAWIKDSPEARARR